MRRPKRILEKKYISTLVIAAFLALSVLTANNIRMRDADTKETGTETKETISQGGNRRDYGIEDDAAEERQNTSDDQSGDSRDRNRISDSGSNTQGSAESEEDSSYKNSRSTRQEEKTGVVERDTQGNESKGTSEASADDSSGQVSEKFHYDGNTKLTWPVLGNVILPYSMDTTVYYTTLDQYACSDGIFIGAKIGEEVKASADGRVVNISDTDRYGTMVTVLIGDYYELYYGQMDHVKYNIGDEVEEGEILGTVAEPTRSFLLEGPHLFFKMTYKGESVNPAEYLK